MIQATILEIPLRCSPLPPPPPSPPPIYTAPGTQTLSIAAHYIPPIILHPSHSFRFYSLALPSIHIYTERQLPSCSTPPPKHQHQQTSLPLNSRYPTPLTTSPNHILWIFWRSSMTETRLSPVTGSELSSVLFVTRASTANPICSVTTGYTRAKGRSSASGSLARRPSSREAP